MCFRTFQACKGLILKTFCFGFGKDDFVLDGLSLGRSSYGVELGADAGGLLAVTGDFAF
jgi:hypothetical protein